MSFTVRLWAMSAVALVAFTAWIFIHDYLMPGLSQEASHGLVAVAAWLLGLSGAFFVSRLHRRTERLAEKTTRDETVIQLAGGVAHEMNQPLTIIISTAELLARRSSTSDEIRPYLHQLVSAGERMADIVEKLERATTYRSKPYVGGVRIVDIDGSADREKREERREKKEGAL